MIKFINKISNQNGYQFLLVMAIFALYVFSALFYENHILSNYISVTLMFCMSFLIYKKIKKINKLLSYWSLVFVYITSWAVCDLIWVLVIKNAEYNTLFSRALYLTPSIISLAIVLQIYYKCIKDTSSSQIITDGVFILILTISFFVFAIFSDKFIVNLDSKILLIDAIYIVIDMLILCSYAVIRLSTNNLKRDFGLKLLLLSLVIFSLYDIFYTFYNIYEINIFHLYFDLIFYISFIITMVSVFYADNTLDFKFVISNKKMTSNFIKKIFLLLLIPILASAYAENLNLSYTAFIFLLMLIYGIVGNHISNINYNHDIIKKEKEIKEYLINTKAKRISKLNELNQKLVELSECDDLTDAFNRPYFLEQLKEMIATKTISEYVSLYTIDINNFKAVNDVYGHNIGDQALISIVKSLKSITPRKGIIGRFGGDDIIIAIKENFKHVDHNEFCMRILNKIQAPIKIENNNIFLTANIGVSFTQTSQIKVQDLMSQSSMALKVAKDNISISYFRHTKELEDENLKKHYIKILIDKADFSKEFRLKYQPQFDATTKKIVAVETFIRWDSAEKGKIKPLEFMPIAEQSPIILLIGKWIIQNSIKQIKYLNEKYNTNLMVSINISTEQLQDHSFIDDVKSLINQYKIDPSLINFEIKQINNILLEKHTIKTINELKSIGINICLDDFGVGFSSLNYFGNLQINRIKIAREFIRDIQNDNINKSTIISLIEFSKNMDMKVIAKCIETKDELEILQNIGCDELQGLALCKPLNTDEFENFLKDNIS